MIVNPVTGEVIEELHDLDDGQLAELVQLLEEEYREARDRYYFVRNGMIRRMKDREAKLVVAAGAKFRLRTSTRIKENKAAREMLARLAEEAPLPFRQRFRTEVTTSVSVLKELAKLGRDWSDKVAFLVEETDSLVIEPMAIDGEEAIAQ